MRGTMWSCALGALMLIGCSGRPEATPGKASDDASSSTTQSALSTGNASDPASNGVLDGASGAVELDAIALTPPAGWERKSPSSSFVAAEFALPRTEGDPADGRLTISTAGGSVEANIDRWKGQFDPQPTDASQEVVHVGGIKVTMVDLTGDFSDQRGPFAPAARQPDYRMIAAIIPADEQLYFVKATGPKKTIAAHADEIRQFILSVR